VRLWTVPILVVFSLSFAGLSPAVTYVVHPDGTGDFPTIQAAVDAASPGDVIELTNGRFTGDGNRDIDYLGKSITVRSRSGIPEMCVIDCQATWTFRHRGFYFRTGEGPDASLQGVTITNGIAPLDNLGDWGGGILCDGASPTVVNCIFDDNVAGWGGGMLCINNASCLIHDCIFHDNIATSNGGGLYCSTYSSAEIVRVTFSENRGDKGGGLACNNASPNVKGCTFVRNYAWVHGAGIWAVNGAVPRVFNSIIAFSDNGASVLCELGSVMVLECCDVYGNPDGDWVGCIGGQHGTHGNFWGDPLFCGIPGGSGPTLFSGASAFSLHANSPCLPGNHPDGADCGLIGAHGIGCGISPGPPPTKEGPAAIEITTWGRIKSGYR
jgi:predicted outer membrane repeat protein